jgi:heptosyltransferase-1
VSASRGHRQTDPQRHAAARTNGRPREDEAAAAILVVRPSSLGDIVHALSIVADIRANRPELAIDWVAESGFVGLLEMHPGIRRIVPVAMRQWRQRAFVAARGARSRTFRDALQRDEYAAVLDLAGAGEGRADRAHGARRAARPDRASIREPIATLLHDVHHAIDRDQHFIVRCRALAAASLGYRVDGAAPIRARRPGAHGALHSRPAVRRVLSRHFAAGQAVARRALATPRRILRHRRLSGGAAVGKRRRAREERALCAGITGAIVSTPSAPLAAEPRGPLRRAELAVGVDTGLVHLAAALGTPTVSLFVATNPLRCGVGLAVRRRATWVASASFHTRRGSAHGRRIDAPRARLLMDPVRGLYSLLWNAAAPLAPLRLAWRGPARAWISRADRRALRPLSQRRAAADPLGSRRVARGDPRCRASCRRAAPRASRDDDTHHAHDSHGPRRRP